MELDLNKPHCRYFYEMLQIPHGSFNEQAISDWVVVFAIEHQLQYLQDDMGNVVVYKPASFGYERKSPILLQAHLDMVCEKLDSVEFDFMKDPIQIEVKEGWLHAKGTTLGADDGTGVSYMLAILADSKLPHPALECVFTVQEETGLTGAMHLKAEYFQARRMINLDCGADGTTMISTAGGLAMDLNRNYTLEKGNLPFFKLVVNGLQGGHSGGNINKERANANKLVARILYHFQQVGYPIQLMSVQGGNKDNAIPRECKTIFAVSATLNELEVALREMEKAIQAEYEISDPDIVLSLTEYSMQDQVLSIVDSKQFLQMMMALPTGLQAMSLQMEDLPMASMNLASVQLQKGACCIKYSLRSALESWLDQMKNQIECIAIAFGAEVFTSNRYPAWAYQPQSKLRELFKKVYFEKTQEELKLAASHGGTECGIFSQMFKEMDIVTCAPLAKGAHTPQECLNLEAFDKTFLILKALLEAA